MMLAFRRRPTSEKQSANDAPAEAPDAPPNHADVSPHHLDYDHRPLSVEGLSHYTQPVVDERFRVH
ncbi:hypothetical protein GCM10007862_03050 [Dyella lipolytica]|uniref:Uncharacterized protein n=1 Tax=Dyella lipolytica TaxID=1867835 RepID=A0ABW8IZR4_9GAMM|nr:hypothetical protein [Dyella lipolytica]GLQ45254.1 hypothetical protein GCM10007862_03050 [Dyella lipolytica]